eukprot:gnl/TRDRNA2_/TRDRNA2_186494_c0_seq1.p1 gnl/TRDRNA2_/TRDRNA2_186494_c0~~gnl/TRDRNA2_/TRDRNA2_186494_c0_seq1.p1  ORF type:complete len:324 (-),score=7.99 gnl/TRDRNA2_/TRDRNA2_186494_c0_seq1:114-1085(-)
MHDHFFKIPGFVAAFLLCCHVLKTVSIRLRHVQTPEVPSYACATGFGVVGMGRCAGPGGDRLLKLELMLTAGDTQQKLPAGKMFTPWTEGRNAQKAWDWCVRACQCMQWCVGFELMIKPAWKSPGCYLLTDFNRLAPPIPSDAKMWGGKYEGAPEITSDAGLANNWLKIYCAGGISEKCDRLKTPDSSGNFPSALPLTLNPTSDCICVERTDYSSAHACPTLLTPSPPPPVGATSGTGGATAGTGGKTAGTGGAINGTAGTGGDCDSPLCKLCNLHVVPALKQLCKRWMSKIRPSPPQTPPSSVPGVEGGFAPPAAGKVGAPR